MFTLFQNKYNKLSEDKLINKHTYNEAMLNYYKNATYINERKKIEK
jgi:hypothetical protein